MDMGNGNLGELSEQKTVELEKKGVHVFRVGDNYELGGSVFKIRNIGRKTITLEVLGREKILADKPSPIANQTEGE